MLCVAQQAGEQVMRRQVLEGGEAFADRPYLLGRQVSALAVEARDGLAHGEVAGGPRLGTAEVAGEEPVRRPLADAGQGRELRLDLVVRQSGQRRQVEATAREADDVRRLSPRETERCQLAGLRERQALSGRKRVRVLNADAEALDQPVANRERGAQGDLLGGDRGDEALEGLYGDRRPQAPELSDEPSQDGIGLSEAVEGFEVELDPEQPANHRLDLRVEGIDVHPALRPFDPHLSSFDHSVQASFVPAIREVGAEGTVASSRELERVRLGQSQCRHSLGERLRQSVEVGKGLERHRSIGEVAGKTRGREDSLGRQCGTAVRVAVADVDDLARRQERAFARLAALVAVVRISPDDDPALGPCVNPIRVQRHLYSLPGEDGLDQFVEPARDDVDVPAGCARPADEVGEACPQLGVLEHPRDDLIEWGGDGCKLASDDLAERQAALVEPLLDVLVDRGVAELLGDAVEEIGLRDGPVVVENDGTAHRHTFVTLPPPTRAPPVNTIESGEEVG